MNLPTSPSARTIDPPRPPQSRPCPHRIDHCEECIERDRKRQYDAAHAYDHGDHDHPMIRRTPTGAPRPAEADAVGRPVEPRTEAGRKFLHALRGLDIVGGSEGLPADLAAPLRAIEAEERRRVIAEIGDRITALTEDTLTPPSLADIRAILSAAHDKEGT